MSKEHKFCDKCGYNSNEEQNVKLEISKKKISYFVYTWTVVVNLFKIFISVAILDNVYSDFEITVVCLLVLIYIGLETFIKSLEQNKQKELIAVNNEFISIKKLIKKGNDFEENQDYFIKLNEQTKKTNVKFWINIITNALIYIIAIASLLNTL